MNPLRFFALILFLHVSYLSYSQDTLYLKQNKGKIKAEVLEINSTEVVYKKYPALEGPVYRTNKSLLDSLRLKSGIREYFTDFAVDTVKPAPPVPVTVVKNSRPSFEQGQLDAYQHYFGYQGMGTACFFGGLAFIYGLAFPVVGTLAPPRNAWKFAPDKERYKTDKLYAKGFNREAARIKRRKAWSNYGIGVGVSIGLIIVLASNMN